MRDLCVPSSRVNARKCEVEFLGGVYSKEPKSYLGENARGDLFPALIAG